MQLQGEILQEEITNISPNRRRRVLMGISFLTFGGCKLCTRGKDATRNHYQYTALECQILPFALVKIDYKRKTRFKTNLFTPFTRSYRH